MAACVKEEIWTPLPKHPMCGHEYGNSAACPISVGTRTTFNSHYPEQLKPCFAEQYPTPVTTELPYQARADDASLRDKP